MGLSRATLGQKLADPIRYGGVGITSRSMTDRAHTQIPRLCQAVITISTDSANHTTTGFGGQCAKSTYKVNGATSLGSESRGSFTASSLTLQNAVR